MIGKDLSERGETAVKYRIVRADPAGNITLFVLDPVTPPLRAELAR